MFSKDNYIRKNDRYETDDGYNNAKTNNVVFMIQNYDDRITPKFVTRNSNGKYDTTIVWLRRRADKSLLDDRQKHRTTYRSRVRTETLSRSAPAAIKVPRKERC